MKIQNEKLRYGWFKLNLKLWIYETHIFKTAEWINKCKEDPHSLHLFIHSAVQIYEFHIFTISSSSFPGILRTQFNDQLPVGLLAQLVRAQHRYRRGQGSSPGKPDFFRLSFRNCISCINNCEDLLYIYLFIPQFKYMSFIYSQFHLHLSRVYNEPI